jgi:hypothetical protein
LLVIVPGRSKFLNEIEERSMVANFFML